MTENVSTDHSFLELEYGQVRGEITKRMELRQGILNISLTFAAALIGVGVQKNNAFLPAVYPLFAFCFVMLWSQNDIRMRRLGWYQEEIEHKRGGGWEKFIRTQITQEILLYPLSILAPAGTFIISELIAIISAIIVTVVVGAKGSPDSEGTGTTATLTVLTWVFIAVDFSALAGTLVLVQRTLRNRAWICKRRVLLYDEPFELPPSRRRPDTQEIGTLGELSYGVRHLLDRLGFAKKKHQTGHRRS